MNMFAKNFEKVIFISLLVIFVILFGWQTWSVLSQQDENPESKLKIDLGKADYEKLNFDGREFSESSIFKESSERFTTLTLDKTSKGFDLLVPPRLARCPSGAHLIPLTDFPKNEEQLKLGRKCSYCGAPLEYVPLETIINEKGEVLTAGDSDRDGIPDQDERRMGLNPDNASDAVLDNDDDGFNNYEEYKAHTDPNNPKSRPSYANKLYVAEVNQSPLEIKLKNFSGAKAGNVKEWNIQLDTKRMKSGKLKTAGVFCKIGDTFKAGENDFEYRVEDIQEEWGKNMKTGMDVNKSKLVLKRLEDGVVITASIGEELYDPNREVIMVFDVEFVEDIDVPCRVGSSFELGDDERGVDRFTLISVDSDKMTARVSDSKNAITDLKPWDDPMGGNGSGNNGMPGMMPQTMPGMMPQTTVPGTTQKSGTNKRSVPKF